MFQPITTHRIFGLGKELLIYPNAPTSIKIECGEETKVQPIESSNIIELGPKCTVSSDRYYFENSKDENKKNYFKSAIEINENGRRHYRRRY